MDRSMGELLVH
jgi:hypothetical protein